MQCILESVSQENIELRDTWLTPDLEEDPIKISTHVPRFTPESPVREGASVSEVIKNPVPEEAQKPSNAPSAIPSNEG